jgi:hypothetical protein
MKKLILASLAATAAFLAAAQSPQPMSRMPQSGPPPNLVPPQSPPVYQALPPDSAPPLQAPAQAAPLYVYDQKPVQQQPATTVADPAQPMAQAQNPPATTAAPSYATQLPYGAPQILQLSQAKVGDDTIAAYIRNSGYSYTLSADQIMYLKQQGVSDAVITTMLNQPKPAAVPYTTAAPAPQPAPTTTVAPSVTYVQPSASYYGYQPYYYPSYSYPAYSYPAYSWWPPISLSFGWGWGWGGGWHGGGGGHGGGGWHGGGGGGGHGGGGHH